MTTDIKEVIARLKPFLEVAATYDSVKVTPADFRTLMHAAEAGIAARLKPETVICTGCLRVGDPPPPPYLSCCPERHAVTLFDLVKGYEAAATARDAALNWRRND